MSCHSDVELAQAGYDAGFRGSDLGILVAIAHPESGGCDVIQQGQPYETTGWGVWQITPGNSVPQVGIDGQLLDLGTNARAAWVKYSDAGHSFSPWTTYEDGLYAQYLGDALNAVNQINGPSGSSSGPGGPGDTIMHLAWENIQGAWHGQIPDILNNLLASQYFPSRMW